MPVQSIRYVLVDPQALDPTTFDSQSPGIDLYAPRSLSVEPGQHVKVDTGVAFVFPPDKLGLIWDKSSVAWSKQLVTEAGVIDTGYRGTVKVVLRNMSNDETVFVKRGQAVAQMLLTTAWQPQLERSDDSFDDDDNNTFRGTRGFGGE